MQKIIAFLKSKYFWLHLGLMALAVFILGWVLIWLMARYTLHGKAVEVPQLKGLTEFEYTRILENHHLTWEIVDSPFIAGARPGTVLEQDPAGGARVKPGRKIYLSVVAARKPKVPLPELEDLTLEEARSVLKSYGLKEGRLIYRPDMARNKIRDAEQDGQRLTWGQLIDKGSAVDLVVGSGLGSTRTPVPELLGLSLEQAESLLKQYALNPGAVIYGEGMNEEQKLRSVVLRQVPPASSDSTQQLLMGSSVDLYMGLP